MNRKQNENYCFPNELADFLAKDVFIDLWNKQSKPFLIELCTIIYLASLELEEGRTIIFNLCFVPDETLESIANQFPKSFWFQETRQFSPEELRRLSVACSPETSAIMVSSYANQVGENKLHIPGILHLGKYWIEGKEGFSDGITGFEKTVIFRVEAPGTIEVLANGYIPVAILRGGKIIGFENYREMSVIKPLLHEGISLVNEIIKTRLDPEKTPHLTFVNEIISNYYINVITAIVNSIRRHKHGGALAIVSIHDISDLSSKLHLKYRTIDGKNNLMNLLIELIEYRIELSSALDRFTDEKGSYKIGSPLDKRNDLSTEITNKFSYFTGELIDYIHFIGSFSGTDGTIVITTDLQVIGFAGEIRALKLEGAEIFEYSDSLRRDFKKLDDITLVGGMRHRSAIKFCSEATGAAMFVISQDGAMSLVWKEESKVNILKNFAGRNARVSLTPEWIKHKAEKQEEINR